MQYIIVENRQTLLLGPIPWKPRFIQAEFDDLEINYQVPPVEPGYVNLRKLNFNCDIEIFPIKSVEIPEHDKIFQQLAGPFFIYNEDNTATCYYSAVESTVPLIVGALKDLTSNVRYQNEIAGTTISIQGTEIRLPTDRESKGKFYSLNVANIDTINWKFTEGFISLTRQDIQDIVNSITKYVQIQFDWEKQILDKIDAAATIEDLKTIAQEIMNAIPTDTPKG